MLVGGTHILVEETHILVGGTHILVEETYAGSRKKISWFKEKNVCRLKNKKC
jgi:hypothetical protein